MFVFRRIMIIIAPLLLAGWIETVRWNNDWLWPGGAVFLFCLGGACFVLCNSRFSRVLAHFLILPVCFSLIAFLFALFLVGDLTFHVTVVLSALALYAVLRQYFVYFFLPLRYQAYSLENLNFYMTLLSAFFLFSSGLAGVILLQLNLALVTALLGPLVFLLLYQFFWIHKIEIRKSWWYIAPISLAVLEIFITLALLPISYYADAFVLAVMVYVMLGLSRLYVQGLIDRKKIWSYVVIGAICGLTVLLTAQWG